MSLKEAALFQSGAFQEAKLNESKLAIIDYYQSKGYVDAIKNRRFQRIRKRG
jgi:outer membrane protein assembly factor BamA